MPKNKLKRWAEMKTFGNVIEPEVNFHSPDSELKGNWSEKIFGNNNPVILELGCGKGEYTTELAKRHPNKNFIGVDIKGARMWKGAKTALENHLKNAAFLRIRIELIEKFFAQDEVSEIWLTFPDPQPGKSNANRRLTSPAFISKFKTMLRHNGLLHLKTDSSGLYDYTMEFLRTQDGTLRIATNDLYGTHSATRDTAIQTTYEMAFRKEGNKICYLCFKFVK